MENKNKVLKDKELSPVVCKIGAFEHNKSIFHLGQCHSCYQKTLIGQIIINPLLSQPVNSDVVDSDFTLWVVVNKWQYNSERHKWFNNYIMELRSVFVTHDELYNMYKSKQ